MSLPVLVTGDDITLPVTLKKNGNIFAIDSMADVSAMLVQKNHNAPITGSVVQHNDAQGADWANSLVVVQFSSADTADIDVTGPAYLEIQVDDNGKRTWFVDVLIVRGQIT